MVVEKVVAALGLFKEVSLSLTCPCTVIPRSSFLSSLDFSLDFYAATYPFRTFCSLGHLPHQSLLLPLLSTWLPSLLDRWVGGAICLWLEGGGRSLCGKELWSPADRSTFGWLDWDLHLLQWDLSSGSYPMSLEKSSLKLAIRRQPFIALAKTQRSFASLWWLGKEASFLQFLSQL